MQSYAYICFNIWVIMFAVEHAPHIPRYEGGTGVVLRQHNCSETRRTNVPHSSFHRISGKGSRFPCWSFQRCAWRTWGRGSVSGKQQRQQDLFYRLNRSKPHSLQQCLRLKHGVQLIPTPTLIKITARKVFHLCLQQEHLTTLNKLHLFIP